MKNFEYINWRKAKLLNDILFLISVEYSVHFK